MKPGSTLLNHKDPGCHFLRQDSLWLTALGESSFSRRTHEPGYALSSVGFGLIWWGSSVRCEVGGGDSVEGACGKEGLGASLP